MNEILVERSNNYSFNERKRSDYTKSKLSGYGTEKVSFLASKIWDILPNKIKAAKSLAIFKRKIIKKWIPWECPCRLLKHM